MKCTVIVKLQARHCINTAVRQTVRRLYELGVSRVVGYPKEIARGCDKGRRQNFLLSHVWRFNYVLKGLKEVAGEYGIQVLLVDEAFTSQTCPLCGQHHANGGIFRGLFKCRREAVVMNADLVGAFNILRKALKKITPSLSALARRGRNWPNTRPEGFRESLKGFLMETPQTSPPLPRGY